MGVNELKLFVLGSDGISDFDLTPYVPIETDTIITYGNNYIHRLAEEFADLRQISKFIMRPQHSACGFNERKFLIEQMINIADAILVIWDGKSKEIKHVLDYTEKIRKLMCSVIVKPSH